MRSRRRVWFDPVQWPARLRWILFIPIALGIFAFTVAVYGTFDEYMRWAPGYIMRGFLAACAAVVLIFTAAYVAPARKRLVALVFALIPLALAGTYANVPHLRPGTYTSVGYVAGVVIGLFIVFNYRSEAGPGSGPDRSPSLPSFPYRDR